MAMGCMEKKSLFLLKIDFPVIKTNNLLEIFEEEIRK
jgi:hypothetical protein